MESRNTFEADGKSWTQLLDKCTGCGLCIDMCPQNVIARDGDSDKDLTCDVENCVMCRMCERLCAEGAILLSE